MIPQNLEKYLSLTVGQLKFLDSFQFTPKSLDVLSKTLEDDEFKYLVESCTTSHFDLVRRKKVYIHMIIWIVLKGLMKLNYHHKVFSSTHYLAARAQI